MTEEKKKRKYTSSKKIKQPVVGVRICSVDGCDNPVKKGNYFLCAMHFENFRGGAI